MRPLAVVPALLLLLPLLPVAPVAGADAAMPLVDAGSSVRVSVGTPFLLDGFVEDFAGAVTVSWTGPATCTISDSAALQTTATCASGGAQAFTLTATDGTASVTDSVLHSSASQETTTLLETQGTIVAGVGVVCCGALPPGGWMPGPVAGPFDFVVAPGTSSVLLWLNWTSVAPGLNDNLDIFVYGPGGFTTRASTTARPETLTLNAPSPGNWQAYVSPNTADRADWKLFVNATVALGPTLPSIRIPGGAPSLDGNVRLYANLTNAPNATLSWEASPESRRFNDGSDINVTIPFTGATLVRARITTPDGFEVDQLVPVRERGELARALTVVAVVDGSFSPYHYDFLGSQHPWNLDADPMNDIDFTEHPAAYIPGMPDLTPLQISIPDSPGVNVDLLRTAADATTWSWMQRSNKTVENAYWFPGTKVIAALKFSTTYEANNAAHGTASASVAAGNLHGTCPECLFVLLSGSGDAGLSWAASQPWIDIVTNSYGAGSVVQANTAGVTRDNAYWKSPVEVTRASAEDGQVVVFSAGNGFVNAFDVPMFTYWSSQKGPDWYVTVGAVDPGEKQTYSGAGKPVDISSIGSSYPAAGGTTANGTGTHSGTSNAAPVTAGTFAKALQKAREALSDFSAGHAAGIVASGTPIACGAAVPTCALGDGILTRRELEDAVYASVLPSEPAVAADTTWPSSPYAYYYQGHGYLGGRIDGAAAYQAEWTRIADHLIGEVAAHTRPAGETNWFVIDSKCRQHLWGTWNAGLYTGTEPTLDPVEDPIAVQIDTWCSALPAKPFITLVETGVVP